MSVNKKYVKLLFCEMDFDYFLPLCSAMILVTCLPKSSVSENGWFEELVAKEARLLTEDSLDEDLELIQRFENGTTVYEHPTSGKALFHRTIHNEVGKQLVVLSSGEVDGRHRRTFVVLRQSSREKHKYRLFHAYLRDADKNGDSSNSSTKHFVEFDGWEFRSRSTQQSSLILTGTLGWRICFKSVLPPCKSEVPNTQGDEDAVTEFSGLTNIPASDPSQSKETASKFRVKTQNGPDYFDLFADLEETPERLVYLQKLVAIYVYTLSAATGAASRKALGLAGIRPPVAQLGHHLEDVTSTKLADMKKAIALFQQTINESDYTAFADLVPGDAEIVENAAIVLLPDENSMQNEEGQQGGSGIDVPQGGLIRGGMFGLLLGPNGVADNALLQSNSAGSSLNSVGNEGAKFEGKAESPGADDLLGTVLEYVLSGGNGQKILGSVAGAIMGADGNGDLIESMAGSVLSAGGNTGIMVKRATSLFDSLVGSDGVELAIQVAENAAGGYGYRTLVKKAVNVLRETDLSYAYPAVDAVVANSPFRQAVGGALKSGLKRIPIVGQPLAMITGFFEHAMQSMNKGDGKGGVLNMYKTEPRVETNLFVKIGWRTADLNPEELANKSLNVEGNKPFIGFGTCPEKKLNLTNLNELSSVESVAEAWSSIFRNQCSDRHRIQLAKLMEVGLVQLEKGVGSLVLNLKHPFISKRKLLKSELMQLSAAFEVSSLSQTIISEWTNPSPGAPSGSLSVSRTISTLVHSVLNGLITAQKQIPLHFIKLVRNLATTLKTAITKLLQDYDRYKACTRCGQDVLFMGKSDLLELFGLVQYLIYEMGPIDLGNMQVVLGFKQFFLDNQAIFEETIKVFL